MTSAWVVLITGIAWPVAAVLIMFLVLNMFFQAIRQDAESAQKEKQDGKWVGLYTDLRYRVEMLEKLNKQKEKNDST